MDHMTSKPDTPLAGIAAERRDEERGSSFGLTRIGRETLQDKTYNQLRAAMMGGQIPPGRVMSVRALAQLLGTSTTPVREALGRLVATNALELLPNGSVRVPILTAERFAEITSVRLLLEGQATELAAPRLARADLQRLRELEETTRRVIAQGTDFATFLQADEDFHLTIYRASGVQTLVQIIDSLRVRVGPYLSALQGMPCQVRRANAHHAAIVRALKKSDPAGARAAVEAGIRDTAQRIMTWLTEEAV
jgi:DNA-binding GntR family transcriptional regulator